MANAQKGEVSFRVGDKKYQLRYSTNAMCDLEDKTGKGFMELVDEIQKPEGVSAKLFRTFFWAGLTEAHPEIDERAAGALMGDLGFTESLTLLKQAMALAFPAADEADGDGDDEGKTPAAA